MSKEIPNNCYGDALREAYNKYHDKKPPTENSGRVMVPLDEVIALANLTYSRDLFLTRLEELRKKYGG